MIQAPNIGEVILHHTADAWTIDFYPFGTIHLPRWHDIHLGPLTVNLSPTKHVYFMVAAAIIVPLPGAITPPGPVPTLTRSPRRRACTRPLRTSTSSSSAAARS